MWYLNGGVRGAKRDRENEFVECTQWRIVDRAARKLTNTWHKYLIIYM